MKRQRKYNLILFLILLVAGIGLGYAALSANLEIDGTTNLTKTTWDIHFDHIQETSGGITPSSPTSINAAGDTVTYNITLSNPGDFYEFTVDAVNAGTVDGMIESFSSTLNGESISNLPDCLTYSVTYFDGVAIAANQLLAANSIEKYKVKVEFREDVDENDLPDSNQTLNFAFSVNYIQANNNAVLAVPLPVSFSTDSWPTIIRAIKSGNTSVYSVGDTKTVTLGNSLGTHTLRIANKSTPSECSTPGFSQTACGFVLEFADVIATHRMNPYISGNANLNGTTVNGTGNKGGWEYSDMRAYLNSITCANESFDYSIWGIYSSLPEVLRGAIINTIVVSGHGSVDTTNYTTTDKLYLLSTHEVWEDVDENTISGIDYYDTAYYNTRQLDYYVGLGVTIGEWNSNTSSYDGNYLGAIKQLNNDNYYWWLRSASSYRTNAFYCVSNGGSCSHGADDTNDGVSPAFRIG